MAAEDYFDVTEFVPPMRRFEPPTCDRCGARCNWWYTGTRWVLNERGHIHVCRARPEEELEDLDAYEEDERR